MTKNSGLSAVPKLSMWGSQSTEIPPTHFQPKKKNGGQGLYEAALAQKVPINPWVLSSCIILTLLTVFSKLIYVFYIMSLVCSCGKLFSF